MDKHSDAALRAEDEWIERQIGEAYQVHVQGQHIEVLEAQVARLREALGAVAEVFVTRRVYEGGIPSTYCRLCKLKNGKHEDECLFAALSDTAKGGEE